MNLQLNLSAAFSRRGCSTATPLDNVRSVPAARSLVLPPLGHGVTESNVSREDDGVGTSFGGTYRSISREIATIVNARSVPTLTCINNEAR